MISKRAYDAVCAERDALKAERDALKAENQKGTRTHITSVLIQITTAEPVVAVTNEIRLALSHILGEHPVTVDKLSVEVTAERIKRGGFTLEGSMGGTRAVGPWRVGNRDDCLEGMTVQKDRNRWRFVGPYHLSEEEAQWDVNRANSL